MATYQQSARVVARQVRGDRILVPLASSEEELDSIYVLNETAAFIWDALKQPSRQEHVAAAVVAAYDVTEQQAAQDVATVVGDLAALKAIERVDA
jgi:hypothetical protein